MPEPRRCTGTTKAGGPCGANPLKDRDVCLAHADAATRESVGFVADNGKGGRPKLPKVTDVLREKVEAEADQIVAALFAALDASEGIALNVKGGGMTLEMVADHRTRITAATALLDRVYGRPKQTTELTGAGGGPIELVPVQRDRGAEVVSLLGRTRALPEGS